VKLLDGKAKPCHDGEGRNDLAKALIRRTKIPASQAGEFLDFAGSGWLDRPRSGEAALAPLVPV
jgi:hypothetical protein